MSLHLHDAGYNAVLVIDYDPDIGTYPGVFATGKSLTQQDAAAIAMEIRLSNR